MKIRAFVTLSLAALLAALGQVVPASAASTLPQPPPLPAQRPVTDDYFGTKIVDPYRYFEDMKDPVVVGFFKEQNDYARTVLAALDPTRRTLFQRIKQLDASVTSVGGVQRDGSLYFFLRQAPKDNNQKLVVKPDSGAGERVLVDPDKLATSPQQHYTISYFLPSLDGKYVAYGLAEGGSEASVIHVVETATGRVLPDTIDRTKFVGPTAWRADNVSFYYLRFPKQLPGAPVTDAELKPVSYLHVLGTNPERDAPVFGYGLSHVSLAPTDFPIIAYSPAAPAYAIGLVSHGVQNEVTIYVAPIASATSTRVPWKKIVDVGDDVTSFDIHDNTLFLLSHRDASRYKVLALDLTKPSMADAKTVVPPGARNRLADFGRCINDGLWVRDLDGGLGRIYRLPFSAQQRRRSGGSEVTLRRCGRRAGHRPARRRSGPRPHLLDEVAAVLLRYAERRVQRYEAQSGGRRRRFGVHVGRGESTQRRRNSHSALDRLSQRSQTRWLAPHVFGGLRCLRHHARSVVFDDSLGLGLERSGVYAVRLARGGG